MDCIVHGVAKSRTQLSHFALSLFTLPEEPQLDTRKSCHLVAIPLNSNLKTIAYGHIILTKIAKFQIILALKKFPWATNTA